MNTANQVSRVMIEQDSTHLNKIVVAQIAKFESQAAIMRGEDAAAGRRDKRDPATELRPQVDLFKAAVATARSETIAGVKWETDQARLAWEKDRDRHADRELAEIRRAENKFRGLSDDDARALAMDYINNDDAALAPPEINELRARLRSLDAMPELDTVNEAVTARNGDSPWISNNPELTELVAYADDLSTLTRDEVAFTDPNSTQGIIARASELIDYDGELAAE
jgi:hypothetical protein